ncbi:hypothetical protein AB0G32_02640 [Streptomyces sp. NPDC023723]|uniref:hypothetical protein n=1 Tax=Streptomyces sp. NPDC023723 TaxID=3154323 RepID=UPI0033F09F9E
MKGLKFTLTRWLASAAVLLGVAVVGPLATAPAASAASGCAGTVVDSVKHYDYLTGAHVATSYLYWDGTYNCVIANKTGSYYGVSTRMALVLMRSDAQQGDSGNFSYYAGPVSLYGKGYCVAWELDMWNTNGVNTVQDRVPAGGYFHCG